MDSQKPIFRAVVTQRLAFPEELTQAVTIIRPCDWIILGTLAAILLGGILWSSLGTIPVTVYAVGIVREVGTTPVFAPRSGLVRSITVGNGIVDHGAMLLELVPIALPITESPSIAPLEGGVGNQRKQMPTIPVTAPFRGRVLEVRVMPGDMVAQNTELFVLTAEHQPLHAAVFVQPNLARGIRLGLQVRLKSDVYAPGKQAEYLFGKVSRISSHASSDADIRQVLGENAIVNECVARGLRLRVDVLLDEESGAGINASLFGTSVAGDIVVSREHPINLLLRRSSLKGSE